MDDNERFLSPKEIVDKAIEIEVDKVLEKSYQELMAPKTAEDFRLEAAVSAFNTERSAKSFSGRHPELGRMVNCPVCDKRHRSAHVCLPRYCDINVLHAKRKAKKEKQK